MAMAYAFGGVSVCILFNICAAVMPTYVMTTSVDVWVLGLGGVQFPRTLVLGGKPLFAFFEDVVPSVSCRFFYRH